MTQRVRIPESYRSLAKAAHDQGWIITQTNNGHLRWTNPEGNSVFTPSSPGTKGGSGILRIRGKLKRGGLILP